MTGMIDEGPWRRFASGQMGFGHRGHLQLTYEVLRRHDAFEAMPVMARHLRTLAAAHGTPGKYHATITGLWMLIVQERMQRTEAASFEEFLAANEDLLDSAALPRRYYRAQTLDSVLARRIFVLPDRLPSEPR